MYRVVDTISYQEGWTHRYPEAANRGEGLLAILDPNEIREPPDIHGCAVSIHRPDGSVADIIADGSEARHSVVAIFFKGVTSEDIPRGSHLEW